MGFWIAAALSANAAPKGKAKATPVRARVRLEKKAKEVVLLGRKGSAILYSLPGTSGVVMNAKLEDVKGARVKLDYDRKVLGEALSKKNWAGAGTVLYRAVSASLPFLDIEGNNMTGTALRAGTYFMRAGSVRSEGGFTKETRQRAQREYTLAFPLLYAVGKADWYDRSELAMARAATCLLKLDRPDDAQKILDAMDEPNPDDEGYGEYNLAYAYLGYLRQESLGSMESVVESIVFETKDIDTFPDALMLSARCYENQNSWHRARDVYYEVACLFRNTHWHDLAMARLRFILDKELTVVKEQAQASNVFFGTEEDMDKRVKELLGIEDEKKRSRPGKEKEK